LHCSISHCLALCFIGIVLGGNCQSREHNTHSLKCTHRLKAETGGGRYVYRHVVSCMSFILLESKRAETETGDHLQAGTPSSGSTLGHATALRTSALVDDQVRQILYNDVHVSVVVEKMHARDLAGRAALIPLRDGIRMRIALVVEEGTFAGAVVGRVASREDDPVPSELLKIDSKRVAAASALGDALAAVQVDPALVA